MQVIWAFEKVSFSRLSISHAAFVCWLDNTKTKLQVIDYDQTLEQRTTFASVMDFHILDVSGHWLQSFFKLKDLESLNEEKRIYKKVLAIPFGIADRCNLFN